MNAEHETIFYDQFGTSTNQLMLVIENLRQRVLSACGPDGEAWLSGLPSLVGEVAAHLGVSRVGRPHSGTYSFVIDADTADGTQAILKLVPPFPDRAHEFEVLSRAKGRGYVGVLAADPARGAVLLQKLTRDPEFYNGGPERDEEATRAVARCIRNKWRGGPEDLNDFPSVGTWARDFHRVTETSAPPVGYSKDEIVKAYRTFQELLDHSGESVVLHGDLHHGNVFLDDAGEPVAIDPKGVAGPLEYEVGALMRNPGPDLLSWPSPVATLRRRAEIFAEELDIAPAVTLKWSVVQLALSAVWASIDADQEWARHAAALKPLMTAAADEAT